MLLLSCGQLGLLSSASCFSQGHIEQWIDFASLEIDANIGHWFRPRMGRAVYLPPVGPLSSLIIFLISLLCFTPRLEARKERGLGGINILVCLWTLNGNQYFL